MSIVPPEPESNTTPLVSGCDVGLTASVYRGPNGSYVCRCLVCARCDKHTGNTHQGHYWSACRVTKRLERPHFCCPGSCELQVSDRG